MAIYRQKPFCFSLAASWDVKRTWLITSELANQRALFTCVVDTNAVQDSVPVFPPITLSVRLVFKNCVKSFSLTWMLVSIDLRGGSFSYFKIKALNDNGRWLR